MNKRKIFLISTAHFFVDVYSSFLEPVLPLLMTKFEIGIFAASVLSSVMAVSRDVMQPAFGYFSDKLRNPIFIILGFLMIGILIPALGIVPNYVIALIFVCLGGLGFAAFHPQGAACININSSEDRDKGMSYFIISGRLGHAVGPGLVVVLLSLGGLTRLLPAMIPAVLITILMTKYIQKKDVCPVKKASLKTGFENVKLMLAVLIFIAALRAYIILSFTTFIPMFIVEEGGNVSFGGITLFLMHLAGTFGVYFGGGILVRKIGPKKVTVLSFLLPIPFLYYYLFLSGVESIIVLCIGDFILCLSIPVIISYAQNLVSSHIGTVTSLIMGLCWGIAGFMIIPTGALAEKYGIQTVLETVAILSVLGGLASLFIKKDKKLYAQ